MPRIPNDIEKDRATAATIEGTFERYVKLAELHAEATAQTFKDAPDEDGNLTPRGYEWWSVASAVRGDFIEVVDEMSRIVVAPD